MIGRRTAKLDSGIRRALTRVWGVPEIHTRQKWGAVWPVLQDLPRCGVRLLDAGCGAGRWVLELAARRPGWVAVGLDRDVTSLAAAEAARSRLGLRNVQFVASEFLEYEAAAAFDVVLSVASVHYAVADGQGSQLWRRMASWLRPGGALVVLAPRASCEATYVRWLSQEALAPGCRADELRSLCVNAGLAVEQLMPVVGPLGTVAKQLDWALHRPARPRAVAAAGYLAEWLLTAFDQHSSRHHSAPSAFLRLVAVQERRA